MIMFTKKSCVALGAVAISLISATKPAQALSIYSGGYSSLTAPSSYSLLNNQPTGFSQSYGSFDSPNLLSQGSLSGVGGDTDWIEIMAILGMLLFVSLGLDTGGSNGATALEPGVVDPPGGGGEDPGVVDPVTPVPTPALLPGLVGLGLASLRKRNLAEGNRA